MTCGTTCVTYATHADLPESLTDRERTILRLLAGGYSNKEIAERIALDHPVGTEPRLEHQIDTDVKRAGRALQRHAARHRAVPRRGGHERAS